jgi:hypothetical protein
MSERNVQWLAEAQVVSRILAQAPKIDKEKRVGPGEFAARQQKVIGAGRSRPTRPWSIRTSTQRRRTAPQEHEHLRRTGGRGDREEWSCAGRLEGGYVAEQLAPRSGAPVHKVEMLKLADEDYPIDAERVEDVIEAAAGGKPRRIGLLTPRAVFPLGIYDFLVEYLGDPARVVDAQEIYYKIKYEKSPLEMELIADASLICDEMLKAMLAVLKPGMLETQVAGWGCVVGQELGAEEFGFDDGHGGRSQPHADRWR